VTIDRGTDSARTRPEMRPRVELEAAVHVHALCQMTRDDLSSFRRCPKALPHCWDTIPPSTLRYSDHQTVVSVAAVVEALGKLGDGARRRFDRWGVLAASRFLGRSNLVVALDRFRSEGVWGVSPHLIPHFALHSPAGTISLALRLHGPNLGVGGGPRAVFEGFLAAMTWLQSQLVPGVWLVFSGWSPEFAPDVKGEPDGEVECQALALALVPADSPLAGKARIRLVHAEDTTLLETSAIDHLGRLLEAAEEQGELDVGSVRPHWIRHDSHGSSATHRPHLLGRRRSRTSSRVVASDATGRMRIELEAAVSASSGSDPDEF